MLNWLRGKFKDRTAVEASQDNPVLKQCVSKSAEIFKRIPLRDYIDESEQDKLSRQLYLDVSAICNAMDPILACREKLAACMLKFAAYQVLTIPQQPHPDSSGLRGQPGVSGELMQHELRIVNTNPELRSEIGGPTSSITAEKAHEFVQRSFWLWYWHVETMNAARIELGDVPDGDDWYQDFRHAACVSAEATYRRDIELPPAFDEQVARAAAMAYPIFTDIVVAGDKNPASAWRDYHEGSGVPFPDFTNRN